MRLLQDTTLVQHAKSMCCPLFVNKVLLEQPSPFICILSRATFAVTEDWSSFNQDRQYLLYGPLQKKFTNPWY